MALDEDASRRGFSRADVGDCDVSGLTPSDPDVYTNPQMRDRIRAEIYCGDKGGDEGEWSARKAQLTVQRYEAEGGGYEDEGEFDESQEDLMVWTEQDWTYEEGGGPRYFPDDFWDELTDDQKKAVSETKKEAEEEGKQFASLPDEVSEKFSEWREENRDKYLEEARENPAGDDPNGKRVNPNPHLELRQRSEAREAYDVVHETLSTWEPWRSPEKIYPDTIYPSKFEERGLSVMVLPARLIGFREELLPIRFAFHGFSRGQNGVYHSPGSSPFRGLDEDLKGELATVMVKAFSPVWAEGRLFGEKDLDTMSFVNDYGARGFFSEALGAFHLSGCVRTIRFAYKHIKQRYRGVSDPPPTGLKEGSNVSPGEIGKDEFVERVAGILNKDVPYSFEAGRDEGGEAEQAYKYALWTLEDVRDQLVAGLERMRSTFVHEFQHHLDWVRYGESDVVSSGYFTKRDEWDRYYNIHKEVNARYQEGLDQFENEYLSDTYQLETLVRTGLDARGMMDMLEDLTPKYDRLSTPNQRRLKSRWYAYWKQIVKPRIEKAHPDMEVDTENVQQFTEVASELADTQDFLEENEERFDEKKWSNAVVRAARAYDDLHMKVTSAGLSMDLIEARTGLTPGGFAELSTDVKVAADRDLVVDQRENPPAESTVEVPGGPNSTVNREDQDAHRPRLNPPVGLPYRYQQMIREEVRNAYAESPPSKANAILPDGSTWAQDVFLFSDPTEEEDETLARISRLLPRGALDSDVLIRQAGGIETAWPWTNAISARTPLTNEQKDALREAEQELYFEGAEVTAYTPTDLSFDLEPNTVETTVDSADEAISFLEENLATVGIEAPADGLPEDFEGGFPSESVTVNRGFVDTDEDPEAFYNWFGESVTTQNGEPKLLYHGTLQLMGDFNRDYIEDGLYFTDSFAVAREFGNDRLLVPKKVTADTLKDRPAEFGVAISEREDGYALNHNGAIVLRGASEAQVDEALEELAGQMNAQAAISKFGTGVVPAYLKLENPLVTDFEGNRFHSHPGEYESAQEIAQIAIEGEYDGAIMKNIIEGFDSMDTVATNYLALRPDQIAPVAEDDGVVSVPGAGHRENPPAESTVDVPGGPSYTVEPDDVVLSENRTYEKLSREKVAAPPSGARDAAQRARKWKEKGVDGMHQTGMERMLQIAAGYQLSPAEMENVRDWFEKKSHEQKYHNESAVESGDEEPEASLVSWWGWGGDEMEEWVDDKLEEMPDRVKLTDEARENPDEGRTIREAFGDAPEDPGPPEAGEPLFDLVEEVDYPTVGTDTGFELRSRALGDTYSYGFARRPDFDGKEYEDLAELGWIQVDEHYQGEGIGTRLLADTLRFLASTGATHVAVRPLSDAASRLNESAEETGLWHLAMEGSEGMEMYAIDVGPKEAIAVPLLSQIAGWDANREDVASAIEYLYSPSEEARTSTASPTDGHPWTYMQTLRPPGAAGDLESEFGRSVQVYASFSEVPEISASGGFLFRTNQPIRPDKLRRTPGIEPHGIDTRAWTLANAVANHVEQTGTPSFAVVNREKKWLWTVEPGESAIGGVLVSYYSGMEDREEPVDTTSHESVVDALEETLRFADTGDGVEFLPMEYADVALQQWREEVRENPAEGGLSRSDVADGMRALAYEIRRKMWNQDHYPPLAKDATEGILEVASRVESGDVEVDTMAFMPLPVEAIDSRTRADLESLFEQTGDLRSVEEFAEEEILPFIGDLEVDPFAPFEEKGIVELVRAQLFPALRWQETGYLLPDGTPLSLGGSGSKREDHRSIALPDRLIPDWINEQKANATMLAAMEEGIIRVVPSDVLGLEMHREPTRDQKQWIREQTFSGITPSQIIVDVAEPGVDARASESDTFGPSPGRVIRFIEDFYSSGTSRKAQRAGRRNPYRRTLSEAMAGAYSEWRPNDPESQAGAWGVHWIMPGGHAIGGEGTHDQYRVPGEFSVEDDPEADLLSQGAVKVKMATYDAIDPMMLDIHSPLTERQKQKLRHLAVSSSVSALHATLKSPADDLGGQAVETSDIEEVISGAESFFDRRSNPTTQPDDAAYVLASGEDESANLRRYKPDSQRLVTMSPRKYLKHARRYFESQEDTTWAEARRSITTDGPTVTEGRVEEMMDRMQNKQPIDALFFDVRLNHDGPGSPIIGQEGRHRAIAADRLGLLHVPVVLYGHERQENAGMFGGPADVKVDVEDREFPSRLMAGATELSWPDESTEVHELWQKQRHGSVDLTEP